MYNFKYMEITFVVTNVRTSINSVSGFYQLQKSEIKVKFCTLELKVNDCRHVSPTDVRHTSVHMHMLTVEHDADVVKAFLCNLTPEWRLVESNCTLDVTAHIVWCVKVKAKAGAAHRETLFTALMSDLSVCEQAIVAPLQNNLLLCDLRRHNFSLLSLHTRLNRASLLSLSCWEEGGMRDFWDREIDAVRWGVWGF